MPIGSYQELRSDCRPGVGQEEQVEHGGSTGGLEPYQQYQSTSPDIFYREAAEAALIFISLYAQCDFVDVTL